MACGPSHHGEWKLLSSLERTCLTLSTVRFYLVLYLILFSLYTVCEYHTVTLKDYILFTILQYVQGKNLDSNEIIVVL